ncbi:cadmium resistance transporter [Lentilactobacillus diolivorans]|uniref:cadmium resistance transporter n=1 Tax=Lentilactobacillus diolivorans TaxID=179838 RepID=UPI0024685B23|nr:cadmium resistance transporter [Lentilactobacillus diolivorans]MDH5105485.1 cadmium resistance transporter [Lentilactobacillus diolivorans]
MAVRGRIIIFTTIITGFVSFVGTNVDDTFVLAIWFSQVDSLLRTKDIVLGQFLGFEFLVLVSVLAAYSLSFIPTDKVGWLGVVPIFLGIKRWLQYRLQPRRDPEEDEVKRTISREKDDRPKEKWVTKLIRPQVLGVSLVTISNGAGNLTVYIPLFTRYTVPELIVTVIIFTLMTAAWCYLGFRIANFPVIKKRLNQYKHVLIPVIFIVLGIYILVDSGII